MDQSLRWVITNTNRNSRRNSNLPCLMHIIFLRLWENWQKSIQVWSPSYVLVCASVLLCAFKILTGNDADFLLRFDNIIETRYYWTVELLFVLLLLDADDPCSITESAKKVGSLLGNNGLNLLVNNAAIVARGTIQTSRVEDMKNTFNTNVIGPLLIIKVR